MIQFYCQHIVGVADGRSSLSAPAGDNALLFATAINSECKARESLCSATGSVVVAEGTCKNADVGASPY